MLKDRIIHLESLSQKYDLFYGFPEEKTEIDCLKKVRNLLGRIEVSNSQSI